MRIATLVLGMSLGPFFLFQSVLLSSVGGLFEVQEAESFGQRGIIAVSLWLVGSSFVFGLPLLSTGVFALASIVCFVGGRGDLIIWGFASVILAGLSYLSIKEKQEADEFRAIVRAAAEALLAPNAQHVVSSAGADLMTPGRSEQSRTGESSSVESLTQERERGFREEQSRLREQIDAAWKGDRPPFFTDDDRGASLVGSDDRRPGPLLDAREQSAGSSRRSTSSESGPVVASTPKLWKCGGCGRKVPTSLRQCPDCKYTPSPRDWERLKL